MDKMPKWADVILIPLISVLLALIVSGFVVLIIGENPDRGDADHGARAPFGSAYGWGYTLYYATNFIFTGLAVAVAFHARLFNIGGEGQAALGGLGVAIVLLSFGWPHWTIALLAAILGSALFGAGWAAIPAYLQAKRGSHIVITTIMFNFIASALLVYLLVNVFRVPGLHGTRKRALRRGRAPAQRRGIRGLPRVPGIYAAELRLLRRDGLACVFVWILIWHTRLGYEIRAFGHSETAAVYAGINPTKIIMITMLISGALSGMMAINVVMGEAERLVLDFTEGAGFVGIAVALMGRSHPVGVVLAALLFGALYQGGAELQFEMPAVSREMIVVIQALVILFTGALDNMVRMPMEKLFLSIKRSREAGSQSPAE
jgi:ABC-type uncharacterized transport system permease subunit